jgi:5'-nucleotidase
VLKKEQQCDLVICLSHLGYKYSSNKVSDCVLATQTQNIDLIIGGHTHTFLKSAVSLENTKGKEVLISQVGFGAIKLGKIDFYLKKEGIKKVARCTALDVRKRAKFV